MRTPENTRSVAADSASFLDAGRLEEAGLKADQAGLREHAASATSFFRGAAELPKDLYGI